MRIKAVLFAGLAQRIGVREEWLELEGAPRAADVFEHYRRRAPELGELGKAAILAVNAEFCAPSTPLREGDEVALLPPMSGGSPEATPGGSPEAMLGSAAVIETALVRGPLPPAPALAPGAHGAVVAFEGIVRGEADGRTVLALEYEAYEAMAVARLRAIAEQAAARWPLLGLSVVHRLGRVEVGEASVRVTAVAAHRAAAFEACRFAIDELKRSAPIWKKEIYRDGEAWAEGELPEAGGPTSSEAGSATLIGIDGCRGGWLVAESAADFSGLQFRVERRVCAVLRRAAHARAVVAIDIPIGLPTRSSRTADREARKRVGGLKSSVFPVPARAALMAASFEEACRLNSKALGCRVSTQSWEIFEKIREVDDAIEFGPECRVIEVHPEVTFAVVNLRPLRGNKRSREGRVEREAILARSGITFNMRQVREELGRGNASPDDVLDAAAALLSASRFREGRAEALGSDPPDARGREMRIWV